MVYRRSEDGSNTTVDLNLDVRKLWFFLCDDETEWCTQEIFIPCTYFLRKIWGFLQLTDEIVFSLQRE